MQKIVHLTNADKIATFCRSLAWLVLGFGLVQIILIAYSLQNVYQLFLKQGPLQGSAMDNFQVTYLYPRLTEIFQAAVTVAFFFAVLYVAGSILYSLANTDEEDEEDEEDEAQVQSLHQPTAVVESSSQATETVEDKVDVTEPVVVEPTNAEKTTERISNPKE